jgi:hypothetical protein
MSRAWSPRTPSSTPSSSDAFLDTAKFPKTGEGRGKLTGDLTLHGVTKPVILDVTSWRILPVAVTVLPTAQLPKAAFGSPMT